MSWWSVGKAGGIARASLGRTAVSLGEMSQLLTGILSSCETQGLAKSTPVRSTEGPSLPTPRVPLAGKMCFGHRELLSWGRGGEMGQVCLCVGRVAGH